MGDLTQHFTWHDATFSATAVRLGIKNEPTAEHAANIRMSAARMEGIRAMLGNNPIYTNSWYRSAALNQKTPGSSTTSDHCLGFAIDFTCPAFGTPLEICHYIVNSGTLFGQIIYEFASWVHLSFNPKERGANKVIHILQPGKYLPGLPPLPR